MKRIFQWFSNNKIYFYILIVVAFSFGFLLNVLFTIQLKYENAGLNDKIFELENRLKSTQQELEKATTDIYIEQEASERLGLVRSDEIPVKVNIIENEKKKEERNNEEIKDKKVEVFIQEWYKDIKKISNEIDLSFLQKTEND